jgi:hypothetical protein
VGHYFLSSLRTWSIFTFLYLPKCKIALFLIFRARKRMAISHFRVIYMYMFVFKCSIVLSMTVFYDVLYANICFILCHQHSNVTDTKYVSRSVDMFAWSTPENFMKELCFNSGVTSLSRMQLADGIK